MPLKKYLSIIIKIVIVFFSFYFIYQQLVENKSFEELDISVLIDTVKKNKVYLVGVILMMFLNWLVEALKWRYMISKIENISIMTAYRAVFTGITVSTFTPNRIGEYGGRVFCLEKGDRIKAVFITVLCSMSQLLVTILYGSISLFILFDEILIDKTFLSVSLLILLNLFLLFSYFNISHIVNFLGKFKLIKSFKKYFEVLVMYNYKDLIIAFIYSNSRYFIFSLQFIILLHVFGINISFMDAILSVMLIFFFITITPTITIAEIGVRGSVAIFVLGLFSSNDIAILSSTTLLWLINLIIPAIIGSFFIFSLKFFRSKL
tara:strand:+ start:2000 stop:2956 length:957 start_codon:yes stop_codon:yes gene_type:complete